jgi:hypothetical protein
VVTIDRYLELREELVEAGYRDEYVWASTVGPCPDADTFAAEACWVILNAGMKEQVARKLWGWIRPALQEGRLESQDFKHDGKREALKYVWDNRRQLFAVWCDAGRLVDDLEKLPWIGPITKFHLARNLGVDCCKPDRHLVRIASPRTPEDLCRDLAEQSGDRVGAVDAVLWRAANLGLI